jgi:hypothetical protein
MAETRPRAIPRVSIGLANTACLFITAAVDLARNFKAVLVDIIEDEKVNGKSFVISAGIFELKNYCDVLFFAKIGHLHLKLAIHNASKRLLPLLDELSIPERKVQR